MSSRLDRSASRISGGSCAGSDAVAASSHRRIATPGRLPRGTAGALGDRGAARALGDQPREARAAIVTRPARQPAVDDDADVVQRHAGLGDAGGEDELALARRRQAASATRCAAGSMPPWSLWSTTSAWKRVRARRRSARSRRRRAGRRAASLHARAARLGSRMPSAARSSRPRRGRHSGSSSGKLLPFADDRRRIAEQRPEPLGIERRRHRNEPQVGRKAPAASSASASARSLSRLRSCTSSNSTAETPRARGQPGCAPGTRRESSRRRASLRRPCVSSRVA